MEDGSDMIRMQNEFMSLALSVGENTWQLKDRRAQVNWGNIRDKEPWLAIKQKTDSGPEYVPLKLNAVKDSGTALECRFVDAEKREAPFSVIFRFTDGALQVHVAVDEGRAFPDINLFGHGLEVSAEEKGDALIPIRMGLLLPAAGEEPFDLHLDTYDYEGMHMAMGGLFKSGGSLMVTWGDPYMALNVSRDLHNDSPMLRMDFELTKTARSLQLRCLVPGKGLVGLAKAYRRRAEELGYRVPWKEKLVEHPEDARLFGACNVKLWHALARRIDEDLEEQSVTVNWTFDEAAQIAEHLKNDLELDNVLFHLGGWTRYGYDCRHPDIMPANPECGGNEALADCARRVESLGYLFCLHDNYQDMYRDAPSWDEAYLEKDADGSPHVGGFWLGGQAYYTCARQALKLAQRPQNLPAVKEEINPDTYFIDTTFAVGPQECYDPRHPLTKQEDIHWKQALSDYARGLFGLFGSEDGREWAVPHADFFEGLASVAGGYYSRLDVEALDGMVVPFFDMVFRDCIAIYGKYGYEPEEMAEQVIHHIAMGRTLYYHSLGQHLYWQDSGTCDELPLPEGDQDPAVFTRAHDGWAEGLCLWDRFIKNTQEVLGPLNGLSAQMLIKGYEFLDEERSVTETTFGSSAKAVVNGSERDYLWESKQWGEVILPPYGFLVEADTFVAFHARSWNGHKYNSPVLFTLRSLDDRLLTESNQIRIFHGFGEAELPWRGNVVTVQREVTL